MKSVHFCAMSVITIPGHDGPTNVAVLGGGEWGRALASAAHRAGSKVLLISRRERDSSLDAAILHSKDLLDAPKHARLIVLTAPSAHVSAVVRELGAGLDGSYYVVHGVRGLVGADLRTVSDVVRTETAVRRVGALGGPAVASELLEGKPNVLVCGSRFPEVCEVFSAAFASSTLRVYPSNDLLGLEWASALVGCLMIAVGYAQGLKMSPGLIAAFVSRSIGEASRITSARGGDEHTLLGLAGYGDLLASTSQLHRPEVLLGRTLAQGKTLAEAVAVVKERVEAIELVPHVVKFATEQRVTAPIFKALAEGILGGKNAHTLIDDLMTQPIEHRA